MASIKKRPDGRWRARYRDDAGREHARHFGRKVDGQRWLDEQTAGMVRGDWADPARGRRTVKTWAEDWEAVQVSSEGTARIVDNALRLHVVPYLGHRKLAEVRPSHVQAMVKHLAENKRLAPGSVRNIYDVTAALFAAAVEDRALAVSPCKRIRLPRGTDGEVDVPTVEEIERVRAALDERWRPVVTILAGSGLRIGELLGLTPADVSTVFRTVRVERQRLQSGEISELPKTKSSRRTVPIGDVVVAALKDQVEERSTPEALFADELGDALTYRRWKRLLADAVATAGVDLTSHGLRHFAASALISGGASVKQVQMFLGHASATITLRTYAHLFPGDEDRTRDVLDAALGPLALADSVRTEAASSE